MTHKKRKILLPPASIGIIGGGQLGRMIAFEAKRMGYNVIVLDPNPSSPASQVSDEQITASFTDRQAMKKLAERCDVLTYEFEHIDADMLTVLESEGYSIYPSGKTLKKIQDKYTQKSMLKNAGIKVPNFFILDGVKDIVQCIDTIGFPFVVKTRLGGYDGKGNYVIECENQIEEGIRKFRGCSLMVEEFIDFQQELSVVVSRDQKGECEIFPIVENVHKDSILRITRVPAKIDYSLIEEIKDMCRKVIETIDDVGVFCIELFLAKDGQIYVNEIAPRPHNSGHYTIEACITSQFEQLVRIITGMPLGSTKLIQKSVMANILGNDTIKGIHRFNGVEDILDEENVYLHLYGKLLTKELKKLGHITVLDESIEIAEQKALKAIEKLRIESI